MHRIMHKLGVMSLAAWAIPLQATSSPSGGVGAGSENIEKEEIRGGADEYVSYPDDPQLQNILHGKVDAKLQSKAKDEEENAGDWLIDGKKYRNPYDPINKTLSINKRVIELRGPIVSGTAEQVENLINFYNERNDRKPIFLDMESPGGSVFEGFRIISAIKRSKAQVHVVIQKYAAGMAALIASAAEHSYAMPNAAILFSESKNDQRDRSTIQLDLVKIMDDIVSSLMHFNLLPNMEDAYHDVWQKELSMKRCEVEQGRKISWVKYQIDGIKMKVKSESESSDRDLSEYEFSFADAREHSSRYSDEGVDFASLPLLEKRHDFYVVQ